MASRLDQFREFVGRFPKVRDDVLSGKTTWQKIYEDWVILGEENEQWDIYRSVERIKSEAVDYLSPEGIKNALGYIKKINPDSISKTLNTVQKVLQITQGFKGKTPNLYNSNYNSWWD